MFFKEVAQKFNEIEQTSSRNEITALLASLLAQASAQEARVICNLALGELYPPYLDCMFNIAQKTMVPIVASLLEVPATKVKNEMSKSGDIGSVVADGLWHKEKKELSVLEVYDRLVALEKIEGTGSQEKKADVLEKILRAVDPSSAKYIVRIILGKLRLGFSDMTVLDALSWMQTGDKSLKKILEEAYNICVDIGFIAMTLKEKGISAIKEMSIIPGIPIRPAAAERLPTAQAIIEKIGPCIAQPKLDGFRLQIHIDKTGKEPKILFFSRNLKNMSAMFPDLVELFENVAVDTLICEGEAIGYDANTNSFLPFQQTVKRKRKHGVDKASQEFPLKLFLFDVLYMHGKSLLEVPCQERYTMMRKWVPTDKSSMLSFIEERYVESAQELETYFKEVINEGLEGLVVKRPNAKYQPGKRNFNWIKLKRSADGALEDTLDVVVLGYYKGAGRRAAFGIGAFLVGVYDKQLDSFVTVAKVGTGLSDVEWIELKKKCDRIKMTDKPRNVICSKELYPDVWVAPEIVCEVFADEITRSPLHTASKSGKEDGLALRFPRFIQYRIDKDPLQATTVTELKTMHGHQSHRKV